MKKLTTLFTTAALALSLCACGKAALQEATTQATTIPVATAATEITGYAAITTESGAVITGYFLDGVPNGYCTVYPFGDYGGYTFFGWFTDGNASGALYSPSGTCIPATYTNGQVIAAPEEASTEPQETQPGFFPTDNPDQQLTQGMFNALHAARNYLNIAAFSRRELIDQLESDKYTPFEATYAADNCGADWKEQAAKRAKVYLSVMPDSRAGLIEQLEFDGFTREQAVYAADQNGL